MPLEIVLMDEPVIALKPEPCVAEVPLKPSPKKVPEHKIASRIPGAVFEAPVEVFALLLKTEPETTAMPV